MLMRIKSLMRIVILVRVLLDVDLVSDIDAATEVVGIADQLAADREVRRARAEQLLDVEAHAVVPTLREPLDGLARLINRRLVPD